MHEHTKHALDGVSAAVALAAWNEWLPPLSAALSVIWLSIQIGGWAWKKWKER